MDRTTCKRRGRLLPEEFHHGLTGLLSKDTAGFARDLATLFRDERLRAALGSQARIEARAAFASESVVERVEQVYRSLLEPRAA